VTVKVYTHKAVAQCFINTAGLNCVYPIYYIVILMMEQRLANDIYTVFVLVTPIDMCTYGLELNMRKCSKTLIYG